MGKYSLFLGIIILFSFKTFSQHANIPTAESYKRKLAYLKNKERVEALNLIAYSAVITGYPGFVQRADTIYHYASLAFEESTKLNYKRGIVDALNLLAGSESIRAFGLRLSGQNDSASINTAQEYLSQAMTLSKEINYEEGLGSAYMGWQGETKGDTTDYMKVAINYFHKAGDERMEGEACTWVAEGDLFKGYYENAFEYCQRGLQLNHKSLNKARTKEEQDWRNYLYQQSLSDIAMLYKEAGDYKTSLDYLNTATEFAKAINSRWTMASDKAAIFRYLSENDSSFYYLRTGENQESKWTKRDIGATFLMTKQYDSALMLLEQVLPEFRKMNVKGQMIPILLYIGKAYAGKKEYKTALSYATEHTAIALTLKRRPDIMSGYELLSSIYHNLGNNDSAYYYQSKFYELKDSIVNRQFLWRLSNYKREAEEQRKISQINLLNKENQLKDQKLKQQAIVRNSLAGGLVLLFLLALFIFKNISLQRKKERIELQKKAAELEMQALRAQMNPHFIFNCLSSVNKFILKEESQAASDYLTRFSRLIRRVLTNSQLSMIPLSDEIEMLKLYLDMERLRFDDAFDYNIVYANAIEPEIIYIPPMLLQPFCENGIWHGLMHKEGKGKLEIEMHIENGELHCTIADNGIGRSKAAELKSKSGERQKSFGLKITSERLALFNNDKTSESYYHTGDVLDPQGNIAGTKVSLVIKYKDAIHELINS